VRFSFFVLKRGPAISYKMSMATSLAGFTICSNHEMIETQIFLMARGNNHFGEA
jgi:hypothetical protein